jgi:hypothetical protein
MAVELIEQRLYQTRLRQRLTIQPDRLCVGHTVLQPEAEEPPYRRLQANDCRVLHERQPVAHLILDTVLRKVAERAQDQRLEHQNCIIGLRPARDFRSPSGLRHTRSSTGRNSSHGTTALISTNDPSSHP